jgi:hypothetical protein
MLINGHQQIMNILMVAYLSYSCICMVLHDLKVAYLLWLKGRSEKYAYLANLNLTVLYPRCPPFSEGGNYIFIIRVAYNPRGIFDWELGLYGSGLPCYFDMKA